MIKCKWFWNEAVKKNGDEFENNDANKNENNQNDQNPKEYEGIVNDDNEKLNIEMGQCWKFTE